VKSRSISPTYGVVYRPFENFAIFAGHTESFAAGTRVPTYYVNGGEVLSPAKTKQNEIGIKYMWEQLLFTLSAFDISQTSTRAVDEGGNERLRTDGELRNKGVEFSLSGNVDERLNLIGGFMYIDARQEKTEYGILDGLKTNGVANLSATLAATYKINDKLTAMARLYHLGSASMVNERFKTKKYTTVDLGLSYMHEINDVPVTLTVKCFNVLDQAYWKPNQHPVTNYNTIILGNPRTFQISLGMRF
jgi:iron complex outermembrane receptor protein